MSNPLGKLKMIGSEKEKNLEDDGEAVLGAEDRYAKRPSSSSRRTVVFGVLVVISIFGGLGAWSATAPLARAIHASAILVVKGERKKIQHFEGGIVAGVSVSEGEYVEKGQLLIKLDPIQAKAGLARFGKQMDHELARQARLSAESNDEDTIVLGGELLHKMSSSPELIEVIEAEHVQFHARRALLNGQVDILKQRITQFKKEIEGLEVQRKSILDQLEIFNEEIIGLKELHQKGFFPRSQLLAMERAMIQLQGFVGSDTAAIARAESSKGETKSQIISLKQRTREQSLEQLKSTQVNISDLRERVTVANDILRRMDVKAPRSGTIQDLRIHTVGGIVAPGEKLMDIVPQDEELIVEAQVSPTDIDSIVVGQRAEVRLTALNMRSTPTIYGRIISVSGDAMQLTEATGMFFLAQIQISKIEKEKLGDVRLSAGMPAEVLIQAGERTALNYFLKPLSDAFARGLNEE
jgi:HlyD family secretion protein/epimerase transport system membrane fusion protein